jgi:hypothetical protein
LNATPHLPALLKILLPCLLAAQASAQSFCASDAQAVPTRLLERFISADCPECWGNSPSPQPGPGVQVLDWIVPGSLGEDAPLSAATAREALERLQTLRIPMTGGSAMAVTDNVGQRRLRVSRGLPLAGYVGASIELRPAGPFQGRWSAWLALVERIPAGTNGTPVERQLVRNVLQLDWDGRRRAGPGRPRPFYDARALSMPAGAQPSRIGLVGWVQDERGQIIAAAATRCPEDFGN